MNQKNDQLKETLISQYSKLSDTSLATMTEKLKDKDWWIREQRSLKTQRAISGAGSFLVFIGCCFVLILSSINGQHPGNLTVPFISFAGLIFALILTQKVESKIKGKVRLFELLKISFDYNDSLDIDLEKV